METYIRSVLRVSVAQICQTIGYNSIQSIPLELLMDCLHKFLQEFARDLHRHVEHFNRTEANLDDLELSLQSLNISVTDLLEYMNHVEPVACSIEVPEIPAAKSANLNFLKPGSKEVLTRPIHVYDHLPPMLPVDVEVEEKPHVSGSLPQSELLSGDGIVGSECEFEDSDSVLAATNQILVDAANDSGSSNLENGNSLHVKEEKRKMILESSLTCGVKPSTASSATREISSVVMTSGGFISPAVEGALPESLIPSIVEKYFGLDSPPAPPPPPVVVPPPTPVTTSEQKPALPMPTDSKPPETEALPAENKKGHGNVGKHLKKKMKKSLAAMTQLLPGVPSPPVGDKAQRKRMKMLQKYMAKAGKAKNGNAAQLPMDKCLKKHHKMKQKRLRQQNTEKQMTTELTGSMETADNDVEESNTPDQPLNSSPSAVKTQKDDITITATAVKLEPLPAPTFGSSAIGGEPPTLPPHALPPGPSVPLGAQNDEIKLSNEPDRSKLNIFKKISATGRKDRTDANSTTTIGISHQSTPIQMPSGVEITSGPTASSTSIFSDDRVINLPSGTTITPAPPSGSGRHVYAPPPSASVPGFNTVMPVDVNNAIPQGSAVLMQRGDLMIHKPKKRGRKPGSKNQPKVLGLAAKKTKKLKKTLFGQHSASNIIEPLNLSHNPIANIANIPLGIASTFPIDSDSRMKMKKERKKPKFGKEQNMMCNTPEPSTSKGQVPTKEEFASINQKLMMMDTVLQAAPPLPSPDQTLAPKIGIRPGSSSPGLVTPFSVDIEAIPPKVKKERKKTKQLKDTKPMMTSPMINSLHPNKIPNITSNPAQFNPPNFSGVPNMGGLPMFSFYPPMFPTRPGLIPSHNLFPPLPNMPNNSLFMPPLMGFQPFSAPIRTHTKDERDPTPPLVQATEGNYSKVAPLVPEKMKIELPPSMTCTSALSPGGSGPKLRSSLGQGFPMDSLLGMPGSMPFNPPQFGDFRRKFEDRGIPRPMSSHMVPNINFLKNSDITIEVSSDDSLQEELPPKNSTPLQSGQPTVTKVTPPSIPQAAPATSFPVVSDDSSTKTATSLEDRRSKEPKKLKKLGKQGKKLSANLEPKPLDRVETLANRADVLMVPIPNNSPESSKKPSEPSAFPALECGPGPSDAKRMKKLLKEGKIKKKKDKKDKNKNKEKLFKGDKSEKRKEEKRDKDKLRKLKKEKKKEKLRIDLTVSPIRQHSPASDGPAPATETVSFIPKLTLKLGQTSQSPVPPGASEKQSGPTKTTSTGREPSPELARISPLVTRPPKQRSGVEDVGFGTSGGSSTAGGESTKPTGHQIERPLPPSFGDPIIDVDSNSNGPTTSTLPASATILTHHLHNQSTSSAPAPSPASSSSTATPASTGNTPQSQPTQPPPNKQAPALSLISEANRPSSYIDAEGNCVWICPACGKVDDGSPMIGCDGCDAWYHWVCVGIFVAPSDNEDWYCRVCIAKKRGVHGSEKKRKRNKKKNTTT